MESQKAIRPSLNVDVYDDKRIKTHVETSSHHDKELTVVKFNNSTNINPIFNRYDYIDFEIPSGFNDISKIDQVVIDLTCEVAKTIPESGIIAQKLFLNGNNKTLNLTPSNSITSETKTIPANSLNRDNSNNYIFTSGTPATNGEYVQGIYTINDIILSSDFINTSVFAQVALHSSSGFTILANSSSIIVTSTPTMYSFSINVPKTIVASNQTISVLINIGNTIANPSATTVFIACDNVSPLECTLTRNIYTGQFFNIQNLPVWAIIDRCSLLINGKVCDEIASQNYFCELALQDRETLRNYSKTMLFDPENYGFLYDYPGMIALNNPNPTPTEIKQSFKYQIPLFSTFLTSQNYLTDFVKDKITVRLYIKPYDAFKVSSSDNAADSMRLLASALYLTGTKYDSSDISNIRKNKGKNSLVSMILLRKYGSNSLLKVQQPNQLSYSPIYGQSIYDLSFINGTYLCLFNMLYPDNVIGGENYLQYAYPPKSTATAIDYDSNKITISENPNTYPLSSGIKRSINNRNGNEYLYTPESAFRLDRSSIIDDTGLPIYKNLQNSDFLRNVMNTTGLNNDFLKTYAIYPMYFSSNISQDYKNQHAEHGSKSIKNIYNIEIILSNPESSTLPFYDNSGTLINTLQNSLWTCGLMVAQLHIKPNGKLVVISN